MRITALIFALVLAISLVLFSNPSLLAHTFSENENALFLTMIDKIKAETQLVGRDISNNTQQAQAHAKEAASLLTQSDPVVNTTWTKEISERNPRVATDLMNSLNDLKNTVTSSQPSPSSGSNSSSIQSKVMNISNLLDEAVSVRIGKDVLNNPKTQALVIANLGNEIYSNYGNALGLPPSTIASMGGMNMSGMNMNMNMNNTPAKSGITSGMSGMNVANKGMSGMNSTSGQAAMNQNNPTIKNVTAYETAQSLAAVAQQAFNKYLKPIAPANATSSTANIEKYIGQLNDAINTKTSFMNVMELVHVRLHPTMITAYNLTTGR